MLMNEKTEVPAEYSLKNYKLYILPTFFLFLSFRGFSKRIWFLQGEHKKIFETKLNHFGGTYIIELLTID